MPKYIIKMSYILFQKNWKRNQIIKVNQSSNLENKSFYLLKVKASNIPLRQN